MKNSSICCDAGGDGANAGDFEQPSRAQETARHVSTDVELDVVKGSPARQRSRRMKMKNTRLEGYLWE